MFRIDIHPYNRCTTSNHPADGTNTNHGTQYPSTAPAAPRSSSCTLAQQSDSPFPPLYASLSTALGGKHEHEKGTLLTMGRKHCHVNFSGDKCVSRRHCRVRLIRRAPQPDTAVACGSSPGTKKRGRPPASAKKHDKEKQKEEEDEEGGGGEAWSWFAPQNKQEEDACKEAHGGLALCVDDLGSKFGTFVCWREIVHVDETEHDNTKANAKQNAKDRGDGDDDDDATTDDATTDDEGHSAPVTSSSKSSWRIEQQRLLDSATLPPDLETLLRQQQQQQKLQPDDKNQIVRIMAKRLQPKQSFILTNLSTPSSTPLRTSTPTSTSNPNQQPPPTTTNYQGTLTIYTGISNSSIHLTRLSPQTFCCTRIPTPLRHSLSHLCSTLNPDYKIVTEWKTHECTHLVSDQRTTTAKSIAAWACRCPMVLPDYLVDVIETRKDVAEEVPQEDDYVPAGSMPMDEDEEVEEHDRRDVLRHCTVIVLAGPGEEVEQLVRAGGAKVFPGYELEEEVFLKGMWLEELLDPSLEEDGTTIVGRKQQKTKKKKVKVAFVTSSARKLKKRVQFLKERGVKSTNAKEIALCMTKLKPLPFGDDDDDDDNDDEVVEEEEEEQKTKEPQQQQDKQHQEDKQQEMPETFTNDESAMVQDPSEEHQEHAEMDTKSTKQTTTTRNKTQKEQDGTVHVHPDHDNDEPMQVDEEEDAPERNEQSKHDTELRETKRKRKQMETNKDKDPPRKETDNHEAPKNATIATTSSLDDPTKKRHPSKRKRQKLPKKSTTGWYAIPPPKERHRYRTLPPDVTPHHLRDHGDEDQDVSCFEEALTETRKDLLAPNAHSASMSTSVERRFVESEGSPVKDFKRFRKNFVINAHFYYPPHTNQSNDDTLTNQRRRRNPANEVQHWPMGTLAPTVRLRPVLPKESERQRQLEMTQRTIEEEERIADALFHDGGGGSRGRRGGGGGGRGSIASYFAPSQSQSSVSNAGGNKRKRAVPSSRSRTRARM